MRLYEAHFLEEFCDFYMKRNDSFSRTQLDTRNLEDHQVRPYEIVCDKYNDENWIPDS